PPLEGHGGGERQCAEDDEVGEEEAVEHLPAPRVELEPPAERPETSDHRPPDQVEHGVATEVQDCQSPHPRIGRDLRPRSHQLRLVLWCYQPRGDATAGRPSGRSSVSAWRPQMPHSSTMVPTTINRSPTLNTFASG